MEVAFAVGKARKSAEMFESACRAVYGFLPHAKIRVVSLARLKV